MVVVVAVSDVLVVVAVSDVPRQSMSMSMS